MAEPSTPVKKVIAPPQLTQNWTLRDLKLPKDEMVEAVAGAQSIPAEAKEFMQKLIGSLDPKISLLKLNAHCFASMSQITIHLTVSKL